VNLKGPEKVITIREIYAVTGCTGSIGKFKRANKERRKRSQGTKGRNVAGRNSLHSSYFHFKRVLLNKIACMKFGKKDLDTVQMKINKDPNI